MHEIEIEKWMIGILDAAVEVNSTGHTSMSLDARLRINDCELLSVLSYRELLARHDSHNGKQRAAGLPALCAPAGMVVVIWALRITSTGSFAHWHFNVPPQILWPQA